MNEARTVYKANRGKGSLVILFAGFLLVFVSVAVPIVSLPGGNVAELLPLAFPMALGLLFSVVLIGSAIKFMISYVVTDAGLMIQQPLHGTKNMAWDEIQEVQLINSEASRELLEQGMKDQFRTRETGDISGFVRMLKDKSPKYKYFTMVTRADVVSTGNSGHLVSLNMKTEEEMIYLKLADGSSYYLTPRNPQSFHEICGKYLQREWKERTD